MPSYLRTCRWFGAKARSIREMRIIEQIPVAEDAGQLWLLQVDYTDGAPDIYSLPVQLETGPAAEALARTTPQAVIARVGDKGVLYDAIWDPEFREKIFQLMASGAILKGRSGQLVGLGSSLLAQEPNDKAPPSQVLNAEQSNSSMLFDNRFFLKLYRKLEDGMNPDVELTRFLSENQQFAHVPAFVGAIEYRRQRSEPTVVALLQAAAPNEGDAWALTLDAVGRYFERVLATQERSAVGCRRPGPVARRTARRRLSRESKVDRPAHRRDAPRARRRVDGQAFRAGAVQRHGATLGLSIDARLTSPGLRPFAKEAARVAGSLPRRGRAGSRRRSSKFSPRSGRHSSTTRPRARSAFTAIIISVRRSTPGRILSFSISKANRPDP